MSERALLLDSINPSAREAFLNAGFVVDEFEKSATQDQLAEFAAGATVLGVRSGPEVTRPVIEAGDSSLQAIGCFSVGTNHIDLEAAAENGIPVFNAAHENTRSVAEHVVGGMFSLLKRTGEHNLSLHEGTWTKTEEKTYEVLDKTIGIVGYGAIGSQVSVLAEAVGMNVIYFDPNPQFPPYGTAERVDTLEELLGKADVTTLHVPGGRGTQGLINPQTIATMKPGSYLINTSRGEVVDYDAVIEALESGQMAGVAADVFEGEPGKKGDPFDHPLRSRKDALLTPHTAGSTVEAQSDIGNAISAKLLGFVATGTTVGAVNVPEIAPGPVQGDLRILSFHDNQSAVLSSITDTIAKRGHNIVAQTLKVKDALGLVAIDIEGEDTDELLEELQDIPHVKVNYLRPPTK